MGRARELQLGFLTELGFETVRVLETRVTRLGLLLAQAAQAQLLSPLPQELASESVEPKERGTTIKGCLA